MILFLVGFVVSILTFLVGLSLIHNDDLPKKETTLTQKEFGIPAKLVESEEYTNKTIFAEEVRAELLVQDETEYGAYYYYTVLKSPFDWVVARCVLSDLKQRRIKEFHLVEEPIWNAKEIYRSERGTTRTIVVYPNCIFTYETDFPLSEEQIKGIIEKLKLQE